MENFEYESIIALRARIKFLEDKALSDKNKILELLTYLSCALENLKSAQLAATKDDK